jgi:protein TonB
MAIQVMPAPAAPAAPPHETPPKQQPQTLPKPVDKLPIPPAPVIPAAINPVVIPPKPVPTPPVKQEQPPPRPSALPSRPVESAPVQGQSNAATTTAEQSWDGQVLNKMERKKRYPNEAQRAGQQDMIYVRMTVDRSGHILDSSIARSQHFPLLDGAVTELVRRINPLPPLPAEIPGDRYSITVPIDFFLGQGH